MVVVHAPIRKNRRPRDSEAIRSTVIYGDGDAEEQSAAELRSSLQNLWGRGSIGCDSTGSLSLARRTQLRISQITTEGVNETAVNLDSWVCKSHNYLSLLGVVTYSLESVVGAVFLWREWNLRENQAVRVFLLVRILSYAYLIWSTWDRQVDLECCHPGRHLPWTLVHTLCVATLIYAQRSGDWTAQGIFMLVTVCVDISLLIIVWSRLRRCIRVVERAIKDGQIKGIHPASMRYLDFTPPLAGPEDLTARQLLWSTVHTLGPDGEVKGVEYETVGPAYDNEQDTKERSKRKSVESLQSAASLNSHGFFEGDFQSEGS